MSFNESFHIRAATYPACSYISRLQLHIPPAATYSASHLGPVHTSMPNQCTIDSDMSDTKSSISRMDHTPGKFCYKGIGPFRHGRAILLQAIHDERDPARAHELKAGFFCLEDKSNYQIRLPLHCNYVSLPLGQADWHSAFYTDVHHLHDLQGYNIHVGAL
jgi:hypothetical protein